MADPELIGFAVNLPSSVATLVLVQALEQRRTAGQVLRSLVVRGLEGEAGKATEPRDAKQPA